MVELYSDWHRHQEGWVWGESSRDREGERGKDMPLPQCWTPPMRQRHWSPFNYRRESAQLSVEVLLQSSMLLSRIGGVEDGGLCRDRGRATMRKGDGGVWHKALAPLRVGEFSRRPYFGAPVFSIRSPCWSQPPAAPSHGRHHSAPACSFACLSL